jgi:quercetin dioxygenase-like cupin family protein
VAIAKTRMTKHTILEEHIHKDSLELLVVLEGQLKLLMNNGILTLNPFDHIKIEKNTNHIAMAMEDTLLIAVTIPKDDGFPR